MSVLRAAAAAAVVLSAGAPASASADTAGAHRLIVTGGARGDRIALRVGPATPHRLDVDIGDDGTTDRRFKLDRIDEVLVRGGAGGDLLRVDRAAPLPASLPVTLSGGAGNDVLVGANGAEQVSGGLGHDLADPGRGGDAVELGDGNDTAVWNPGDGSDTIDGEAGGDVMVFNGANGGETVDVSAVGERVRFFRDPGAIAMDLGSVEGIDFAALGGPDHVRVGDLTGTPVRKVVADLAAGAGTADGLADTVTVVGTAGVDAVTVAGGGALIRTTGLPAIVDVAHPDGALDLLEVDTGGGDDTVDSSALAPGAIGLSVLP